MLVNARFLCFSYAGGLLALANLLFGWPAVDVAQLMALVAVLHLVESVLILVSGHRGAVPAYVRTPRGEVAGGFTLQKFWPLPVVALVALPAAAGGLSMPGWWPLLGAAPAHAYGLFPVVAGLGYGDLALAREPVRKSRLQFAVLFFYSLLLLALAVFSRWEPLLLWVAALFSPLGHEAVIHLGRRLEFAGPPLHSRPPHGVRILDVWPGSPFWRAGVRGGDVVAEAGDQAVDSRRELLAAVRKDSPLDVVFFRDRRFHRGMLIPPPAWPAPGLVTVPEPGDEPTLETGTGGPGSRQSVIALSLVGQLARRGRTVVHATGSRSFTQTLRKIAGRGSRRTQSLFKYFNSFTDAERNGLEVLILDEAHRIRETSANRWTPARLRTDRRQVDELIAAARVPVFLLDEHQVVRPGEMGTVEDIEAHARQASLPVVKVSLDAQFRCGGSEEYLRWVLRLLGLTPGGPIPWAGDPAFDVQVADRPQEMEHFLQSKLDAGYGARMAAGYCWPWSDPRPDSTLEADVVIGDWSRPWNLKGERATGGAPPATLWATDPAGFSQVGCVYTAQGFEYDWNGVIIGPDLVWRGTGWTEIRSANKDPDFRNRTKVTDLEFGRLIRNVYKVLLTRGMIGTIIYSPDAETRQFLTSLVR
jgi:hypothetical protein